MSYTVTLELPDGAMTLADRGDGDRPRQAPCAPDQPKTTSYVAGSGFIGGADGPASAFVGEEQGKLEELSMGQGRFLYIFILWSTI